MITGKYLENPALYSPDELERLDNHIEKYFGKATTVVHEFFSEDIHVDVSIIPPHEEHNYYTLVTTGMGAFSMKIPSEYQEDGLPSRIELMMCLPPEWNPESKESQENWPVELLRYLARFPIIESTWLGYGHSIQNGTPYADNTLLAGCVLLGVQDAPEGAAVCKLSDGSWVGFYQVIPLTENELEYKIQHTMIHAVSGKGRMEECLLELDMDTGRCRIAPLPGMGEGLKLRWFTGDWLLVQGNGEILSDDFAQLINRNTREVLRIRPGMFGGENMQHIGILTDGTVVIVTRRDRVGPVFRYPIDFWGFLRTANKPKKLEWREYKEVYPNLPIFLPPKATEQKIILKKDSLTILGAVFTPPFTLSQLAEKLGPARIVLQNGTRKSPITGRESPYTQALALWDELGLQGWLDEDEQTIKTLGVRVAAQGEYAVRQTFDGTVWIGSKDYREASWKDFAGFAHTLKLGGFTVYTRLPGPVSEEQSAQKAKLEALSAMVQISWKEPEQKAAKAQKYKLSKPTEPVLTFTSFNFKLAVMEVLMYEKGLLAPKLDAHEFAREYSRRKIDIDAEGYEPIPEIRKWLEKYPVPERLAPEVTEIEMDGGSEIYTQLCPFWDGEDGAFDLNTITEAELRQFPNLKHITLMSSKPEQVLPVLERCGIKVDLL